MARQGEIHRVTGETDVKVRLDLDGTGQCQASTGVPFLDHMLHQISSHGLTHSDAHVLVGVVIINVSVSDGMDLQIDQAVAADLVKHVVEERNPGPGLALTGAIQIQPHLHVGLAGDPMDLSQTCHHRCSAVLMLPHMPVTQ